MATARGRNNKEKPAVRIAALLTIMGKLPTSEIARRLDLGVNYVQGHLVARPDLFQMAAEPAKRPRHWELKHEEER